LQGGGRGERFKPFQGQALQIHLLTPFFCPMLNKFCLRRGKPTLSPDLTIGSGASSVILVDS